MMMADKHRLEAVRRTIQERRLDAFLITSIINVGYLTGFTGSTGAAIVTPERAVVLVDSRYSLQASEECRLFEIRRFVGDIVDAATGFLNELRATRIGFEENAVTYAQHRKLRRSLESSTRLISASAVIDNIRLIKDDDEISRIRRAAQISDRCFTELLTWLKPGMEECEVALQLEICIRRQGADKPAFESIIATGPNSAHPHHRAGDAKLRSGHLVKMDYGAEYKQYPSDITRTVVLGRSTAKQREVYKIVLDAQLAAIDAIRPGMRGCEIDAVARDFIAAHGYGEHFGHGLGHSLGLGVHDGPGLSQRSNILLVPGMVMTVEPGIYIEGWGGVRIEDDIIITSSGCEIVTTAPKMELIEV